MLLQTATATATSAAFASPFHCRYCCTSKNLTQNSPFSFPKIAFLPLPDGRSYLGSKSTNTWLYRNGNMKAITPNATMLEAPVLWAGRLCIFYALLKAGLAGSPSNPLVSDLEGGAEDLGFSKWFEELSQPDSRPVSEVWILMTNFGSKYAKGKFPLSYNITFLDHVYDFKALPSFF